ncbi:hypothetical protein PHYBLDRAFT_169376 [Phycomyces blakesleeanus NRRL 1555(-)]|uniref:Uncharacterized protein n=1 Tax=Phycomyces blakesleeanus (strain ATCC 8743b / DSM 1359 / FGSC 10004 / NBRC 33097 / NRRL 1555) TaxID=763407 RepID=A0A162NIZ7_PHYB8|nr:hypothetical protein PHYBLDRAFT_171501 [Phycomyces blakesleeanus NRRL 1555(-)]XP_018291163.1 hypothetical protein PHYBLDRAFT_169376 [Phycomyces blakesleeanus NRRL 1555(-)]OAD70114.1 hypothetical protein PHYBLDRAFT_171501 [Phycomyces blakesleeanus NRRL 1555(-)]OAD73123.1 hypothetical protein PHYBLDRAFT_169376 [Phycomyces blakesleeanus NRRL 1555(-)]|eukprot:XP_018288154.1 hypothetical protein PHYBLDRAFT_171501 [Phycomyces blakesleeanus NRRL 1555(-)]
MGLAQDQILSNLLYRTALIYAVQNNIYIKTTNHWKYTLAHSFPLTAIINVSYKISNIKQHFLALASFINISIGKGIIHLYPYSTNTLINISLHCRIADVLYLFAAYILEIVLVYLKILSDESLFVQKPLFFLLFVQHEDLINIII